MSDDTADRLLIANATSAMGGPNLAAAMVEFTRQLNAPLPPFSGGREVAGPLPLGGDPRDPMSRSLTCETRKAIGISRAARGGLFESDKPEG